MIRVRKGNKNLLHGKKILIIDDEPDVLEALEYLRTTCDTERATSFDQEKALMESQYFDPAILDIMGVNGFELLKTAVSREFPTVMLTAHAVTPEALKKSMKLGAVSFLPKEKMSELRDFLEDVVTDGGKSIWIKFFDRLETYFNKRFGPDWKEKDKFFKEFEESLKKSEQG